MSALTGCHCARTKPQRGNLSVTNAARNILTSGHTTKAATVSAVLHNLNSHNSMAKATPRKLISIECTNCGATYRRRVFKSLRVPLEVITSCKVCKTNTCQRWTDTIPDTEAILTRHVRCLRSILRRCVTSLTSAGCPSHQDPVKTAKRILKETKPA